MTVSTIASIAAGITRATSNATNNKASSMLDSLVSGSSRSSAADSANLTTAIKLQNEVAQFRVASQNVAQASSVLTVAAAGAADITKALAKMKDLAARASATDLPEAERVSLNGEFQVARSEIDRIGQSTRFNGEPLLTGTSEQLKLSGDTTGQKSLSVGSFIGDVLFPSSGPDPLDLTTSANAKEAFPAVFAALAYVAQENGKISTLQDGLDYASSTIESAIQNQDATRATLDDADFAVASADAAPDAINSLIAQTSRLPSNILQLLSE
ncbi:MAG: hypothetical protein V4735_09650 [Pseudomonadota bacterium]